MDEFLREAIVQARKGLQEGGSKTTEMISNVSKRNLQNIKSPFDELRRKK